MFTSFQKAFNKNKSINKIPEPILKAINNKLPKGFKYEPIDKESCYLKPIDDKINISFDSTINYFNLKNPKELMEYLYRSQKQLEIKSKTINMNGQTFDVKDLIIFPLKDHSICEEDCKFIIKPPAFPPPFDFSINYENDKSINIKMQRQPYEDLNKSLFKSINLDYIEITYIIDELNNNMKINYKINLDKAKNIKEIIIASKLYKMFENGEINIKGAVIKGNIDNKNIDENFSKLIEFWEKAYAVSEYFKLDFELKDKIFNEDFKIINDLYKSFIDDTESEEYIDTDTLTITFKDRLDKNKLNYDNEILLQFTLFNDYLVLGKKLRLFSVVSFSNFEIENILEINKNPYEYEFKVKAIDYRGLLKKVKFFKNEESVNSYIYK